VSNDFDKSFEARVLDRRPGTRKAVSESEDFIVWRDSLPSVIIDNQKFYIRGGDILKDEDQLIFEWARKHGLLSDEMIGSHNDAESTQL
jgi:hypothetical protein